jgi:hypothetical protein
MKIITVAITKAYGGLEVQLHAFSTLAPDGGEWSGLYHLLYPCGKSLWVLLNLRLNRPYSQCACVGEQTVSLPRMKNSLLFQPET